MKIFLALAPILAILLFGYMLGKKLPSALNLAATRLIGPLVWAMLFLIGLEFGEIIFSAGELGNVLKNALVFSLLTTTLPCALIFLLKEKPVSAHQQGIYRYNWRMAMPALREAGIALSMVVLGALFFAVRQALDYGAIWLASTDLLLLLVLLVGVDLAHVRVSRQWLSFKILSVPVLVVLGSLLGALAAAWICDEELRVSLALSSGFGWFSLSSVLIGEAYGHAYGTMALLTDLFRELLAISILYAIGQRHPQTGIGSAAATALDTTLPIIKQTCSADTVPVALVSGFLLTLLAPLLMTLLLV